MALNVEARSLASLNLLAANPPQYPVNPTEEKQESLVLYISRVPGTRDVILSTFKPQLKNVTAEDVANSLYYVHLELPLADLLPPTPIKEPGTPRTSRESSRSARSGNQIARKPLPANTKVSLPQSPSSASEKEHDSDPRQDPPPQGQDGIPKQPDRPAEVGAPPKLPPRPAPTLPQGVETPPVLPPRPAVPGPAHLAGQIHRKPLGPRPIPNTTVNELDTQIPPADFSQIQPRTPPSYDTTPRGSRARSPSPQKRSPSLLPFSLNLIRRDPSTGNQWNIGKISSYQVDELDIAQPDLMHERPAWDESPKPPPPPINILIETSGYAKFRGLPARRRPDSFHQDSTSPSPNKDRGPGGPMQAIHDGFTRQVVATYTKSWTSNLREKFRRPESPDSSPVKPTPTHSKEQSGSSSESHEVASGDSPITVPGPGLKPQGYMFMSPWEGRCEFRTGNAGRSLKCRYISPETHNMAYNPLVASSADHRNPLSGGHSQISELRYNLPTSDLFRPKGDGENAVQHLHGHFSRLFRQHSAESDDDEGPASSFDLSLGRERAGGGTRGKRAKLGKLIVSEEGLKMLDLVVAANMGIWWGAWERSF